MLKDVDADVTSKQASGDPKPAENAQSLQVEVTTNPNHVGTKGRHLFITLSCSVLWELRKTGICYYFSEVLSCTVQYAW